MKLFSLIDVDGSKTIDREETLKFWSTSFAKLNTQELFSQVDKNNDGTIQLDEWVEFWTIVYTSGYTEDEMNFELDNLINKGSWVKFETNNKQPVKKNNSIKNQSKK
jgi:Ca2+-binding EF-hand superfamily protein